MRLLTIFAAAMFLFGVNNAGAGDFAERRIIGFSEDGKYFAFEQFGVQDGSGFPFSHIFIINTATDSWAAGSPFRTTIEDEQATVQIARAQSAAKAQSALQNLAINDPGKLLLSNPATELNADPHHVKFLLAANYGLPLELTLQEFPKAAPDCESLDIQTMGFSLSLSIDEGEHQILVHQDNSIPSSRNCPLGYQISDVIMFGEWLDQTILIFMINVESIGFEGPNGRYIAITRRLN